MYSLCSKLYTNYTQTIHWSVQNPTRKVGVNPTQNATWKRSKPCTKRSANPALQRRAIYLGAHLSEIRRRPLQKSNNFERFFSDLTLTFLTYRNTFHLPILPTRRIIFSCLLLIKIWGRQRKTRGRQILPGCASKSPILKGKWRKKGGAEAPPISLYKYNTFHRQKQEVLKPK